LQLELSIYLSKQGAFEEATNILEEILKSNPSATIRA